MSKKIVRSICLFRRSLDSEYTKRLEELSNKLEGAGYEIQTKRLCIPSDKFIELETKIDPVITNISFGKKSFTQATNELSDFLQSTKISFCLDLTDEQIEIEHAQLLFSIIREKPVNTFNFSYSFNTPNSSPFFNCTNYEEDGFSIGLQSTNLAEGVSSLQEWLDEMLTSWRELMRLFGNDTDFLGIDGSVAPLFSGHGSFINFVKKLGHGFPKSVTTDIYTQITKFLNTQNPKIVGMNGLMFPAMEDFDLANEYSRGEFPIERNVFLSLHSGLGIDTYPIGVDESPQRLVEILRLVQALSNKYRKHLAVRLVSDGKAKIGEESNFQNPYLKDVVIRQL